MKYNFQVIKKVYKKGSFSIFSCIPLENYEDLHLHPIYQNFSIKGNDLMLIAGREYECELEFVNDKHGNTYQIVDSDSMLDLENFDAKMNYKLLLMITTESQADYIQDAYPDFCKLILDGKEGEIDVKKIYNVKHKKLKVYIEKIKEQFACFSILIALPEYKLTIKEGDALAKKYNKDVDLITTSMQENPYNVLIEDCGRDFYTVDKLLLDIRSDLKVSQQRCESLCSQILSDNEYNHNATYLTDSELAEYVAGHDSDLLEIIVDTVKESTKLHYNQNKNRVSKASTYNNEKLISNTLNKIVSNNSKLKDLNWREFRTIKDGELTDEQCELLHMFCENRVVILNAKGGTGKTSSLLALLNMLDDYGLTYKLFSPTGKAAKRLSESTFRDAATIHRGTQLGTAESTEDVIVIDEMSMLTLETMAMVCRCVSNKNVRIVFVGDLNQLPPIGLGFIANELISSGKIPTITLTKVFRFNSSGMAYVTTLACDGVDYTSELDKNDSILRENTDYEHFPYESPQQVINAYLTLIKQGVKPEDIVVITPRNTGEVGTYALNNLIQNEINPVKNSEFQFSRKINGTTIKFHKNDLVLVTKNKYDMYNLENYNKIYDDESDDVDIETTAIFNGEIGRILSVEDTMQVLIDNEIIVFDESDVENLLLGYALTTWKMQGSESPYTIVLTLNNHKTQLNRQLLYTGLSRARKKIIEISDIDADKYALENIGLLDYKCQVAEMLKGEIEI